MSENRPSPGPVFSFEFFPPSEIGRAAFSGAVRAFAALKPVFMDLTFGAGDDNNPYLSTLKTTLDTLPLLRTNAPSVPLIVHLPNNRFDQEGIKHAVKMLSGVEIMPMGGNGAAVYPDTGYRRTEDCITGLSEWNLKRPGSKPLELTVAVEPEKADAIDRLKDKIKAAEIGGGAKVVRAIMQYSYDTDVLLAFPEKVRAAGVAANVEIVPGFMPIRKANRPDEVKENKYQPGVLVDNFGVPVSPEMTKEFSAIAEHGAYAIHEFAVKTSVQQLQTLQEAGVTRFHFFAANAQMLTRTVMAKVWPDLISPMERPAGPAPRSGAVYAAAFK